MATIGIDLGTTNSLAVTYREGEVQLIPNSFGDYLTPSVVHVLIIRPNSLNVPWEPMKCFTSMGKSFRQRICQP